MFKRYNLQHSLNSSIVASNKSGAGFTLIETIIYIALLGLIMGGTLTAAYELLQSGASLNGKTATQSEASFVLRKLSSALSGASDFLIPGPQTLTITRYDGVQVDICFDSSNPPRKVIKIRRGSSGAFLCPDNSFLPITTENVFVNDLLFQQVGSNPKGASTTIAIDGKIFQMTKYLRK